VDIICGVIIACLSLQARLDPPAIPAWSLEYNAHSTLTEYVAATSYVEQDSYRTALIAPADKPIERYWMEDPVDAAASFAEYKVETLRPRGQAAVPIRPKPARTVRGMPVDNDTTAAIAAAMARSEDNSFGTGMGFSIDRGWGFKVPDTIVHRVQASDWW
jgi:hypothetical protein